MTDLPTIKSAADIEKWANENHLQVCYSALHGVWSVKKAADIVAIGYGRTAQSAIRKATKAMRRRR
jgi:hypothetical protein